MSRNASTVSASGPPLPPRNAQRRGGPRAKALYDFDGDTREGELPLFTGDIVFLNRKVNGVWMCVDEYDSKLLCLTDKSMMCLCG